MPAVRSPHHFKSVVVAKLAYTPPVPGGASRLLTNLLRYLRVLHNKEHVLHTLLVRPLYTKIPYHLRCSMSQSPSPPRTIQSLDVTNLLESRLNNHGLRGSASPVLTATDFVNGRWQFSTPTESTPFDRSPKIGTGDYVGGPTAVPNLVQIRPRGTSGQMGEI